MEKNFKNPLNLTVFRSLGFIFGVISAFNFYTALVLFYNNYQSRGLLLLSYVLINAIFAFGLWNLRKWTLLMSGVSIILVIAFKGYWFLNGIVSYKNFFFSLALTLFLFLFIYSNRKYMKGGLVDRLPICLFILALISVIFITIF